LMPQRLCRPSTPVAKF